MSIPDFQSLMLPLLKLIADEQEYCMREIIETLAWEFNLTDEQKNKLLPSGQQSVFENRVSWARTYLKKAVLVESPRRAFVKITDRGLEVIQQNPRAITAKFLSQYPEFGKFKNSSRSIKFDLTTNDDWDEDLEVEPDEDLEVEPDEDLEVEADEDLEVEPDEEWDSDSEPHSFSAKLFTRREELLKLVSAKNGTKHTLFVEGENNEIVITYLFGQQKLVTVWNRSTALEVAEAIQYYFDE